MGMATLDTVDERRRELASFLRSRRDRLSPGVLGLPEGGRRRTPGLRREEVAQDAGVGVTWYTWLEQGRAINASAEVLAALARTLRLGRFERKHPFPPARGSAPELPVSPGPASPIRTCPRSPSACRPRCTRCSSSWSRSRPTWSPRATTCWP